MEAKITRELAAQFRAGRCLCERGEVNGKELKEDAGVTNDGCHCGMILAATRKHNASNPVYLND